MPSEKEKGLLTNKMVLKGNTDYYQKIDVIEGIFQQYFLILKIK